MSSRSRRRLVYFSSDSPRAPGRAPDNASTICTVTASTVRLEHRLLAHLGDPVLDLRAGLVVRLFDPGGMDPPVLEELLQRQARDLAADTVEPGQEHGAGCVVDDEVDPGQGLEDPDVS